ncbi:MAG: hypothetical protein KDF65_15015 [Anaerolineae bacterium]|nr:hypothetical protein [Anaerolineae bacterium]
MKISVIAKQGFTALGRYRKIILVGGLSLALVWASSHSILGDPPVAIEAVGAEAPAHPPPAVTAQALAVNTADREAVRTFYNT